MPAATLCHVNNTFPKLSLFSGMKRLRSSSPTCSVDDSDSDEGTVGTSSAKRRLSFAEGKLTIVETTGGIHVLPSNVQCFALCHYRKKLSKSNIIFVQG